MPPEAIHLFELNGQRFAVDTESCFCFECDAVSWDVLAFYPDTPVNAIVSRLADRHSAKEVLEVVGELEWLRSTRSILPVAKPDEVMKAFEFKPGLRAMSICLPTPVGAEAKARRRWLGRSDNSQRVPADWLDAAVALLFSRSGDQKAVDLELVAEGDLAQAHEIARYTRQAAAHARLAGKALSIAVRVRNITPQGLPAALQGHTLSVRLELDEPEAIEERLAAFSKALRGSLKRLAQVLRPAESTAGGRIILRPDSPAFAEAVPALDDAGFAVIELDLEGAYVAHPDLKPDEMLPAIGQTAVYYAERLLKHHYFRLDPIASLFWRIYQGQGVTRSDPAGVYALAIDADGAIYPSLAFAGQEAFRLGSVPEAQFDDEAQKTFEDVGAVTTPACIRCWAHHLCGGGSAAVHQALSGSFRHPHEAWCDAQRAWLHAAVAAFSRLSAAGINFTRLYNTLGRAAQPSLFTVVRAAFRMHIGLRGIEENDAARLTEWENWSESAYFLFNDTGLLLATRYDREMDALHPRGMDRELMLVRRNGEPFGLLKMRPDKTPGLAHVSLFMRDERDFAADAVRKSFKTILKEVGGQQTFRRMMVPAAEHETALQGFLESLGFVREGTWRQALFLHGRYRDVHAYTITTADL
jgi:uncharacterized protein